MTDDKKTWLFDEIIADGIRDIPEINTPDGFSTRVMANLEPKRPSSWSRFLLWLIRPQALTFRPLQVVPVMVGIIALLVLSFVKIDKPISQDGIQLSTVRFILNDTNMNARNVSVIGSFNNWKAERSVMWYNQDSKAWILEAQLPPGDHEYLFLVNGEELVPDPQAQMSRDDGFGNKNSIMFVNDNEQML